MRAKLELKSQLDLSRDQLVAIAALGLLVMVCMIANVTTLLSWSDAAKTLDEQRDQLAGLQARVGDVAGRRRQAQISVAPPPAFLDATTSGLAAAQFQAYLSQMIVDQRALLVSSGIQPAARDAKSDEIRLQVALTATLPALQTLLYKLESGTPYVFVDALLMQPGGSTERSNTADPVLKVTMTVRALWRRKAI
jgi:general secretion pathway protein M